MRAALQVTPSRSDLCHPEARRIEPARQWRVMYLQSCDSMTVRRVQSLCVEREDREELSSKDKHSWTAVSSGNGMSLDVDRPSRFFFGWHCRSLSRTRREFATYGRMDGSSSRSLSTIWMRRCQIHVTKRGVPVKDMTETMVGQTSFLEEQSLAGNWIEECTASQ